MTDKFVIEIIDKILALDENFHFADMNIKTTDNGQIFFDLRLVKK